MFGRSFHNDSTLPSSSLTVSRAVPSSLKHTANISCPSNVIPERNVDHPLTRDSYSRWAASVGFSVDRDMLMVCRMLL